MSCNAMNEKQTITLYLQGMTCTLCAKRVEEALKEQPGYLPPGWILPDGRRRCSLNLPK